MKVELSYKPIAAGSGCPVHPGEVVSPAIGPITYRGAVPVLLCSALAAYHSCHEERTVTIDNVAITHDLGQLNNIYKIAHRYPKRAKWQVVGKAECQKKKTSWGFELMTAKTKYKELSH